MQEMKAVHESAGELAISEPWVKMQNFAFNQLCCKNCFGKIDTKFIGPPSTAKVVGP
jgi:hypothetical protein